MLTLNAFDIVGNLLIRFFPTDAFPLVSRAASHPSHRVFEAVRVVVVLESDRLGADMSFAKGIVFVPFDRQNLTVLVFDGDTTHRFAECAGAVVSLFIMLLNRHRDIELCFEIVNRCALGVDRDFV